MTQPNQNQGQNSNPQSPQTQQSATNPSSGGMDNKGQQRPNQGNQAGQSSQQPGQQQMDPNQKQTSGQQGQQQSPNQQK